MKLPEKSIAIFSLLKWIPALVIFSISWYLSSQETVEHMPSFWNADKLIHFVCFGGLCFWVSFACSIDKFFHVWIPTLIVSLYGIIDEIHQSFVQGRNSSVFDWIADTAGAFFGAIIFLLVCRKINLMKKNRKEYK